MLEMRSYSQNELSTKSFHNLFRAYLKLVRPSVVMMGVTNGLVGIFYAGITTIESIILGIIALITIAAIAAFSYGYNMLTDLEEDRINAPTRPLVTGELSVKEAKIFLFILLTLSILPLLIFSRFLGLFIMLMGPIISGITYSLLRVKRSIIKPFFVAYGWSFVPIIAYTTVTNSLSPIFLIFLPFFMTLMFLTTTMGDLRDVKGDKINNVRTLPSVFGVNATISNLKLYTILNYSLLIFGVGVAILPIDSLLGLIGGILLFQHLRTSDVIHRQKGLKKSLARFSWITSLSLVMGRILAIGLYIL